MWPVQEQINLIYIFNVKLALKVNMNEKNTILNYQISFIIV